MGAMETASGTSPQESFEVLQSCVTRLDPIKLLTQVALNRLRVRAGEFFSESHPIFLWNRGRSSWLAWHWCDPSVEGKP